MTDLFADVGDQSDDARRQELIAKWADKSKEEILEAKVNADLYVNTLTQKLDNITPDYLKMKERLDATASLEELRDQIVNAAKGTSNGDLPNANTGSNESQTQPIDIEKKFKDLYEQTRKAEQALENTNKVMTTLKDRFGNGYQQVLRDTGLSDNRIRELAAEAPEAVFRLVGLDQQRESFQAPPRTGERFVPKGAPKRDWNYYQEMKKSNPKLYLDPKITVQMHNDAIALGEAFYN